MWFQVLAFESPSIDLDITMVIQLGIFLLMMLFLHKFVLVPYLKAYDERDALTDGAREKAFELEKKAKEAQAVYDSERQEVYAKAESARRQVVAKANEEASKLLEQTRMRVQNDIQEKQRLLNAEIESARRDADREINAISSKIADRILV